MEKTEAQQHYEEALRIKVEADDFLSNPRCFDCEHIQKLRGNTCTLHGEIPSEYLYEINECDDFYINIPF